MVQPMSHEPPRTPLLWSHASTHPGGAAASLALCFSRVAFLQAVTFVDPAIGRSAPTCPMTAERVRGPDEAHGAEQHLPFCTAVEAGALCEMEEALRVGGRPKPEMGNEPCERHASGSLLRSHRQANPCMEGRYRPLRLATLQERGGLSHRHVHFRVDFLSSSPLMILT